MNTTFCNCSHQRSAHTLQGCVFCSCSRFQFKPVRSAGTSLLWFEKAAMQLHQKLKPYIQDMEDNDERMHTNIIPFPKQD